MTPEKKVQERAIKYARERDVPVIRMTFRPGAVVGWPDALFLIPGGRPLFIEFKGRGPGDYTGHVTPLQQSKIDLLRTLGYDVCIAWDVDTASAAIARALDTAALHAARGRSSGTPHDRGTGT